MPNEEQAPAWAQPLIDQCKSYEKQIRELEEEQEQQRKKKEPEKKKEEPADPEVARAVVNNLMGTNTLDQRGPSLSSKLPAHVKEMTDKIMNYL